MKKLSGILLLIFIPSLIISLIYVEPLNINKVVHKLPEVESESDEFIFLSDTQMPIWIETLRLDENGNALARRKIFNSILSEKPAKVFHMGDLTEMGFKESTWAEIDNFVDSLYKLNIPFYPVAGNHEYLIFPIWGEMKLTTRFPYYTSTGYVIKRNGLAVVLLNSNINNLTVSERKKQNEFFRDMLDYLDKDDDIKAIIVGCHHSPFTNSKIVNPSYKSMEKLLELFYKSHKTKAFISGHAHAFEHFRLKGKDFFVIGGGGGLQQPLLIGDNQRWHDYYSQSKSIRNFHYLKIIMREDSLCFIHKKLKNDKSDFVIDYKICRGIKY